VNAILQLEPRPHTEAGCVRLGDGQNELGLVGDETVILAEQLRHLREKRDDLVYRLGHHLVLRLADVLFEVGDHRAHRLMEQGLGNQAASVQLTRKHTEAAAELLLFVPDTQGILELLLCHRCQIRERDGLALVKHLVEGVERAVDLEVLMDGGNGLAQNGEHVGKHLGIERHGHTTIKHEVHDTHAEGLVTLADRVADRLGLVLQARRHDLIDNTDDRLIVRIVLLSDCRLQLGNNVATPGIIVRAATLDSELLGLLDIDWCDGSQLHG